MCVSPPSAETERHMPIVGHSSSDFAIVCNDCDQLLTVFQGLNHIANE